MHQFSVRQCCSAIMIFNLCFVSSTGFAVAHRSDLPGAEPSQPIFSEIDSIPTLGGFDELVPYVMASPNQEDAGSCLYMALTGIAEWWLARLNPSMTRTPDGPLDLSERYTMNLANSAEDVPGLEDWRTDSIYLFNYNDQKALANSTYRYTKGWYGYDSKGNMAKARARAPGSEYGTQYNWFNDKPDREQVASVEMPKFEREILFRDPQHNQWNIGVAPKDIVTRVKSTLRTRKAPVLVIYNHNNYWHAVYIIGYNDEMSNNNCAYTERFRANTANKVKQLKAQVDAATDADAKSKYESQLQSALATQSKLENAYAANGGCSSNKGVFYIRDSIYPEANKPIYDYDLSSTGDEGPYSKRLVFKEYDWLRYFANHVAVIYATRD